MMRKVMNTILAVVGTALVLAGSVDAKSQNKHEYPSCGMVTRVTNLRKDRQKLTIQMQNGNKYVFISLDEDWQRGDLCAVILNDNGTARNVHDDRVIDSRYVGWEADPSTWVK